MSQTAGLREFYSENGPTGFCRYRLPRMENDFGIEGYLVMLVGNRTPYHARPPITPADWEVWERHRQSFQATAQAGLSVKDTLAYVRHPGWVWHGDMAAAQSSSASHQGR